MRGYFEGKNQKNNKMQNCLFINSSGKLIKLVIAAIIVFATFCVIREAISIFEQRTAVKHVSLPSAAPEYLEAVKILNEDIGSIEEQRKAIDKLSYALQTKKVTSAQLGRKGMWLREFRLRVDAREAVEAWEMISYMEKVAKESSGTRITNEGKKGAIRLSKVVSKQIDSRLAKAEGLKATHASLNLALYRIKNDGANPP